jgi:hypothetical protein
VCGRSSGKTLKEEVTVVGEVQNMITRTSCGGCAIQLNRPIYSSE